MGLDASQARWLCLTARKNNLEYEIQQSTQAKMMLAQEMDHEALRWSNGMNIQHLYYSPSGGGSMTQDMQRLSYQIVTGDSDNGGLGYKVRDSYGRLVVPELPDPMPEGKTVADYAVEPYCGQADYFETNLKTGNWRISIPSLEGDDWIDESISGSTFIYQGVDSKDYAIANAEYEAKVENLERKEKRLDMSIQQLAAERNAVETEIDSVKKVIDKNIEETFKAFG